MSNSNDPIKSILEQMQKASLTEQPNQGLNTNDGPKGPIQKPKVYYRCQHCNELHSESDTDDSGDDSDEMMDS